MQDKVSALIGLAAKAGRVQSGEFAAEKCLNSGKCRLLVLAEDVSENTRKKFTDLAARSGCPVLTHGSKQSLGHSIGKGERSTAAVSDESLAAAILKAATHSETTAQLH